MIKQLLGSPDSLRSIVELDGITTLVVLDISLDHSNSNLIKYLITLLEMFNYESKKLQSLNYCDYELAYVVYSVVLRLISKIDVNDVTKDFVSSIKLAVAKKADPFQQVRSFLRTSVSPESSGLAADDPLMARFNSLKEPVSKPSNAFITTDSISPQLLKPKLSDSVLLIDFRELKDFNHNHINHQQVINIQPNLLTYEYSNDQDLEAKLKLHLPQDQFTRFQNRYKYDLVVLYNFRYDFDLTKLGEYLTSGHSEPLQSAGPFYKLIDLIMFKNKYISSKLKHYPVFLKGGILNWYNTFGEKAITKTEASPLLPPPVSLSRNGSAHVVKMDQERSSNSPSPYLKHFGEYLSTAKTEPIRRNSYSQSTGNLETTLSFNSHRSPSSPTSYIRPSQDLHKSSTNAIVSNNHVATHPMPVQQPATPKRSLSYSKSSSSSLVKSTPAKTKDSGSDPNKFLEKYTTGLVNLGNSCYMNCIVQCLGSTHHLTRFFFPNLSTSSNSLSYRQHININNKLGTKGILTNNFVGLLINMFTNNSKYFTPTEFKKVIGSLSPGHQFATSDQQDCNEFLTFILDGLHEDLNQMAILSPEEKKQISELTPEQEKTREYLPVRLASTIEWERYLKLNFSVIVDYFQGQYLSQLKCLECRNTSTTYNAFSVLSLPIPNKMNGHVLLDDCLEAFTTTELLDDNNRWRCPKCKRQTKLTKKITITRLPQVLIIHFKRFKISPQGYFNKLDTFIKYPVSDVLDLTKYWPEVGTSMSSDSAYPPEKESQILSTLPTRNQVPPFRYKLNGVANHFGNLTTGHYTAYVYKQSDSKKTREWCYFDDAKITYNCPESQVLNKNAYCLFYNRL